MLAEVCSDVEMLLQVKQVDVSGVQSLQTFKPDFLETKISARAGCLRNVPEKQLLKLGTSGIIYFVLRDCLKKDIEKKDMFSHDFQGGGGLPSLFPLLTI